MHAHVSTFQLLGVPVLALGAAVWIVCVGRILRRRRFEDAVRRRGTLLGALPHQRQTGPDLESVELTPAERDAFAGLVRQFGDRPY
ncbi:hypothetical protein AAW14_21165 [Streptomyces hygroscopicus]|uniref:hypothetical protein n=1 Tax=Streptomyces hygroscopicus TaxID=1912 RepID=UPI00223F2C74|nr:hypothetical protein [Streptomyces hygroscopicus]MCW7944466.1 hypothetical protein [Streptomyces hygroscopicus]